MMSDFRKSMAFQRAPTPEGFYNADMLLLEERFHTFKPTAPKIPDLVHFIWLGSPLPDKFRPFIDSWSRFHHIKLWTGDTLTWSHPFAKLMYDGAINLAEKSDILRYEILYQEGGIYSDVDVLCLKPFHTLLSNTFFAGQQDNRLIHENGDTLYLCNALFGATANHPVLDYCLNKLSLDPNESIFSRSGQGLMTRAFKHFIQDESLLALPCSYFYPLPFFEDMRHKQITDIERYIAPESMAIHFWAATWLEPHV